ncbi:MULTISPECIES: PTS sugar transporter subunit IIB [unclassified Clostridium]|uniref:PTS sugar transporter subunit IIB n=1 Tax=unclassified Clostridium TaxID=2614128 RepID=UPI00291416AC|nr:PTS sugar transporter subunit IIB [Clostridium sp.]MDU5105218.1 PTS sugar transporter subunit IIB [Clostridium sp.]
MINILLVCNAGMSTSILVEKMKKVAIEKGIEAKIWALSSTEAKNNKEDVDVVLIAPQLKFAVKDIQNSFQDRPIEVIDMRVYGTIDGDRALNQALNLIK